MASITSLSNISISLLFLFCVLVNINCLRHKSIRIRNHLSKTNSYKLYMGYLPPEKDPEYKNMVKKSLLAPEIVNDIANNLPTPKEGDIVQCPGLWQNEKVLGKLQDIQVRNNTWVADILPLKEGKASKIYVLDGNARLLSVKLEEVSPVKSYFVRAENGYNITTKLVNNDKEEVALRAPSYQSISLNYTFPKKVKAVSITGLEADMEAYNQLKQRIILDSLKTGGIGSLFTWGFGGFDIGFSYSIGCLFGALYLYLLGKKVDVIGYGISSSEASKAICKKDEILAKGRFLTPLLLVLLLSSRHTILDPLLSGSSDDTSAVTSTITTFHLLNKGEFLGAIGGFLTHRLSLFYTEIISQMTTADWLSFLPGSFAEGFRQKETLKKVMSGKMNTDGSSSGEENGELTTVVCVSGPYAGGRTRVVQKLRELNIAANVQRTQEKYKRSRLDLRPCTFVTTDKGLVTSNSGTYKPISTDIYSNLQVVNEVISGNNPQKKGEGQGEGEEGSVLKALFKGSVPNIFGDNSEVALLPDQLPLPSMDTISSGMKPVYLVDGPPTLIDALSKNPNIRLISIWISLQTKEQFVAKATTLIQEQLSQNKQLRAPGGALAGLDDNQIAQQCAVKLTELVNEAARDVTYYMQRAPLFEYTLLNSESDDETASELLSLLESTFQ